MTIALLRQWEQDGSKPSGPIESWGLDAFAHMPGAPGGSAPGDDRRNVEEADEEEVERRQKNKAKKKKKAKKAKKGKEEL